MPTDSKPRREYLPLDTIARALDPRLQLRRGLTDADGNPALWSEAWVQHLLSAHEDGQTLPPLGLVREAKPKGEKLYLFSGWHRYAMWTRVPGVGSVECEVFEGDFLLALRKAAVENTTFGLNRSPECCRAAFEAVFLNDQLREEIIRSAPGNGGITRSLARACGLGKAIVPKYLAAFGWRADRKERALVRIEEPAPVVVPPAPAPHANGNGHHLNGNGHTGKNGTHHHAGMNGSAGKRPVTTADADPERIILNGTYPPAGSALPIPDDEGADALDKLRKYLTAAVGAFEAVMRSPLADVFARNADRHGCRVARVDQLANVPLGEGPRIATVWNLPTLQAIRAAVADTAAAVAAGSIDHLAEV